MLIECKRIRWNIVQYTAIFFLIFHLIEVVQCIKAQPEYKIAKTSWIKTTTKDGCAISDGEGGRSSKKHLKNKQKWTRHCLYLRKWILVNYFPLREYEWMNNKARVFTRGNDSFDFIQE